MFCRSSSVDRSITDASPANREGISSLKEDTDWTVTFFFLLEKQKCEVAEVTLIDWFGISRALALLGTGRGPAVSRQYCACCRC